MRSTPWPHPCAGAAIPHQPPVPLWHGTIRLRHAVDRAMNANSPGFFVTPCLMACQWDAAVVTPIASDKLWITVLKDGAKACSGQQVIVKVLAVHSAKVTQVVWTTSMNAHAISDGFRQNSRAARQCEPRCLRQRRSIYRRRKHDRWCGACQYLEICLQHCSRARVGFQAISCLRSAIHLLYGNVIQPFELPCLFH